MENGQSHSPLYRTFYSLLRRLRLESSFFIETRSLTLSRVLVLILPPWGLTDSTRVWNRSCDSANKSVFLKDVEGKLLPFKSKVIPRKGRVFWMDNRDPCIIAVFLISSEESSGYGGYHSKTGTSLNWDQSIGGNNPFGLVIMGGNVWLCSSCFGTSVRIT